MSNPVNYPVRKSLFPSGSQGVATYTSDPVEVTCGIGAMFFVDKTAGTGTVTVTVQAQDPLGGWYDYMAFGVSSAGVGKDILVMYPAARGADDTTQPLQFISAPIPRRFRLSVAVGTAAVTATITADILQ